MIRGNPSVVGVAVAVVAVVAVGGLVVGKAAVVRSDPGS